MVDQRATCYDELSKGDRVAQRKDNAMLWRPLLLALISFPLIAIAVVLPATPRVEALPDTTVNATCPSGAEQSVAVPAGVYRMRVTLLGAAGAASAASRAAGGGASSAAATFDVTPGQTYYVVLGCRPSGQGGGGNGGGGAGAGTA